MPQDSRVGVGIACLVFESDGDGTQVLLGKRKGSHGAGLWSTPGGWLEYGEQFRDTAVRELKEEVGLELSQPDLIIEPIYTANSILCREEKQFATIYFAIRNSELIREWTGEVKLVEPDKCEEWRWFPVDDLPSPLFPSVDQAIARALEHFEILDRELAKLVGAW